MSLTVESFIQQLTKSSGIDMSVVLNKFRDNSITNMSVLSELQEQDIIDLDFPIGVRRILLQALSKLKNSEASSPAAAPASSAKPKANPTTSKGGKGKMLAGRGKGIHAIAKRHRR